MDMDEREHHADVERWRERRLARLRAPDGWLSLVGLHWLREGEATVGSSPSSDVVLPASSPARVGTIVVEGERAVARFDPAAAVTNEGRPVTTLELRHDAGDDPTVLQIGSIDFHLVLREGRLGVRVRDPHSPARTGFAGIEHYPVDLRWRAEARFEPHEPTRAMTFPTVLGTQQTYEILGRVGFELDGEEVLLEALHEPGGRALFLPFADGTNRDDTYGGGRYLYAGPPDGQGRMAIDFNRAYNPPCAFTAHATCILAPPQNRLEMRIEAGEKRYVGPHT